jgi:hypothetical protein
VVVKLRDKMLVSKRAIRKFDAQKFYLKKLNDADFKLQNQVKVSNGSAALEILDDNVDVNRVGKILEKTQKKSATDNLGYY